jgi:twinkle protein
MYYEDAKENYVGTAERFPGELSLLDVLKPLESPVVVPDVVPTGSIGEIYRSIQPHVFQKYNMTCTRLPDGSLETLRYDLKEVSTNLVVAQKIRKLPKDFYTSQKTKGKKLQLFGQDIFTRAKRLLITEGELDALSAYQMLEKYRVACVSLPLGANVKTLMDNLEYLKGFKEIFVSVDQDDAGKTVARDIANLIPQARFLKLSEKDANDMLTSGKQAEFVSAFFDANVYKPEFIVRVSDVLTKVLERPTMGIKWPWPTLTKMTYGRNPGQGMYVGAGVKQGKSEFINELVAFDVKAGRKIAVLKYEEPPVATVKRVAGKIDGMFYHKPGVVYNDADLLRTVNSLEPYLYMYPAFGKATWESTKEFIRYVALSGCSTVVLDPITKLTNHLNSSETETELRKLSDELACMAQDMGFYYIVTCHLKAPTSGVPHERGGKVQSYQFRGSRSMMENCFYLLGIERNKDPDLTPDEINTSTFVLLEDRNFGSTGKFQVFYDVTTQAYLEPTLSF